MNRKRGQAALEFLTTYGWAFLVVLVMIGALAYFGVLDPKIFLPEKCVFGAGIGCVEYAGFAGSDGMIVAILKNGFGYGITVEGVYFDVTGVGVPCTACTAGSPSYWCNMTHPDTGGTSWKSDTQKHLNISCPGMAAGTHPNVRVEINYTKSGGAYTKMIEGQIQVKPI